MELIVKGRNTEVSQAIRDYIEKKVGKLDHYLDHITQAEVELTEEETKSQGDHFVIQVTTQVNGTILRAEEKEASVRAAVDAVTRTMVQQIKRYKGKAYGRGKSGPTIRTGEPVVEMSPSGEDEETTASRLVKVKRFSIKPMDPEEAVEQMELLGHGFFLFFNSETQQYGVVYRRADGDYGLIEPELP